MISEGSWELKPLTWCGVCQRPQVSPFRIPWTQTVAGSGSRGTPMNPHLPAQHSLSTSVAQTSQEPAQLRRHHQLVQPHVTSRALRSQYTFSNRVPRLTSLLLHFCTDGEIANCCNHYVRLWRFLKKINIWVFFKWNKIIIWKRYLHLPQFIEAYLQQPRNGNNLTVHWGVNG